MRSLRLLIIFITCACSKVPAQVNLVRNPDFETYSRCPKSPSTDNIVFANFWSCVDTNYIPSSTLDSFGDMNCTPEYLNTCSGATSYGVPWGSDYYQYPHSGDGMAHVLMYYDETTPHSPPYYRDYLHGRLFKNLTKGKSYCTRFYVVLANWASYGINRIGAYLNDGSLDTFKYCGMPHPTIVPQVFSSSVIKDTLNWIKIEGSFTANGDEKYITIGNFFSKSGTTAVPNPGGSSSGYSYYLVDDVSVIETDLPADAGPDQWVPVGDSVFIGRGLDSTKGLDCKWYHKGVFIDSGAGIFVHATTVGAVDTYAVVQTICGLVKTDTVLVLTASVGIDEVHGYGQKLYELFPNPSKGQVTIRQTKAMYTHVSATICDLSGRQVFQGSLQFENGVASIFLPSLDKGVYVIQLHNPSGGISRMQIVID